MRSKTAFTLGIALFAAGFIALARNAHAQTQQPVVRLAEIEIDPQYVAPYRAALQEGIEAAIRLEPGVLTLCAVSVKNHPEQVRVFEVYASQAAYQAHLQTPHFKKYKTTTQGMVRSLKLIETDPILLRSRQALSLE